LQLNRNAIFSINRFASRVREDRRRDNRREPVA
jgi:hypothetical protein